MPSSQQFCLWPAGSSLITGKPEPGSGNADNIGPAENMAPVIPPAVAADPADQKSQGLEVCPGKMQLASILDGFRLWLANPVKIQMG